MPIRSRDDRRRLGAFIERIDVVCPRCGGHAVVRMLERKNDEGQASFPARLTCAGCGNSRMQNLARREMWNYRLRWDGNDPFFRLPLWLAVRTRHGVLIAYNLQHLDALAAFIGAGLRERSADPNRGWSNASMVSRLPHWMKRAEHRDDLMRAITRLRAKALEISG